MRLERVRSEVEMGEGKVCSGTPVVALVYAAQSEYLSNIPSEPENVK